MAGAAKTASGTAPFSPFEWMLASRYLRARRKEGLISVIAGFSFIGILLGVATLIIVMAVMNGFRAQLFEKVLGLNGHANIYKVYDTGPFTGSSQIADRLMKLDGVTSAVPTTEGQVMFSSARQALGVLVRGVTEKGLHELPLISTKIQQGTIKGFDKQHGIAIGEGLADALGVGVGDAVTVITPRGVRTPFGIAPRSRSFPVAAIFKVGMSHYDRAIAFMPLVESQRFFSKGDTVDYITVMADSPAAIDARLAEMRKILGNSYSFISWRERDQSFFTVLEVERVLMFIILSLIILVASLNIISGIMMLVKDKGRDIGILRTMGATKGAIMRVFLITGASIGVAGTIGGFIVGVVFCHYIEEIKQFVQWLIGVKLMDPSVYYLAKLPAEIDVGETAAIVILSLALAVLATLYPSWRASRLDPVEALRYE
jgi:lipoprotein-releasing system permease protein